MAPWSANHRSKTIVLLAALSHYTTTMILENEPQGAKRLAAAVSVINAAVYITAVHQVLILMLKWICYSLYLFYVRFMLISRRLLLFTFYAIDHGISF